MNKIEVYKALEDSEKLPVVSKPIVEVLDMIRKPEEVDLDLLADKVALSPELQHAFITNVNSGYYRLSRKIDNLNEAIVFLGLKTVQNLLIYFVTDLLFQDESGNSQLFANHQYWKHNIGTAVACNLLSSKLGIGDKYKLFSYGLCHDIGFAVLGACLPETVDKVYQSMQKGVHQVVAEKIALGGLTHADIGAWICKKWGFPEDVGLVIEFHHSPLLAKENTEEIKLIHIADRISTDYYEKLLGLINVNPMTERIVQDLGVSTDLIKEIGESLPAEVEKVGKLFMH